MLDKIFIIYENKPEYTGNHIREKILFIFVSLLFKKRQTFLHPFGDKFYCVSNLDFRNILTYDSNGLLLSAKKVAPFEESSKFILICTGGSTLVL